MASEEILARLRATGGGAFNRTMQGAARNVRGVGTAAHTAGRGGAFAMRNLSRETGMVAFNARRAATAYGAWKVADVFRDSVRAGIEFNKVQDAQRVGFTTLLGSQEKAAKMMADVQKLAIDSPLLDPSSAGNAVRSLLAYGVAQEDVIGDTKRLGDMAAASGKEITEAMTLGARALGQIEARGSLSREELNQLADSVGLNQKAIREQLGMTRDEFNKTFRPGHLLSSDVALPAIRRAMEAQSKGASDMLSETAGGQFKAAQERFAKNMGKLTRKPFDAAGLFVGELSKDLDEIAGRDDLDISEKMGLGKKAVEQHFRTFRRLWLDPATEAFEDFWEENRMDERLRDGFEKAAPKVLDAAGDLAKDAAVHFAHAWWDAGPWAKLFTGLYLARKLGAFGVLGNLAADRFAGRFGKKGAPALGEQLTLFGDTQKGKASRAGRMLGVATAAGMTAYLVAEGPNIMADLAEAVFGNNAFSEEARRNGFDLPTTMLLTPEDAGNGDEILTPEERRQRERRGNMTPEEERRIIARERRRQRRQGNQRGRSIPRGPSGAPTGRSSSWRMPSPPTWVPPEIVVKVGRKELARVAADQLRQEGKG